MKTVLIIAYYSPQTNEIGGLRPFGLARYIREHGWQPVILTREVLAGAGYDWPVYGTATARTSGTEHSGRGGWKERVLKYVYANPVLYRIGFVIYDLFYYPDPEKHWFGEARPHLEKILQEHEIDLVFSTSKPETAHLIGHLIKERLHLPWVADFRDLWTQNHIADHIRIRRWFEKRLERRILSAADTLTTTSGPFAEQLRDLGLEIPVYSILNGFDPALLDQPRPETDRKFSILYTGRLYKGKRDPEILFRCISDLIGKLVLDPEEIELVFYGQDNDWLAPVAAGYQLQDIVRLHSLVPREEVLEKQRRSQILLLLTNDDPRDAGMVPAKIFEYFTAGRPVLAIGSKEKVICRLLEETAAGVCVSDYDELCEEITRAWRQYRKTGVVPYGGRHAEIMKHSQREMARQFADVFDTALAASRDEEAFGQAL